MERIKQSPTMDATGKVAPRGDGLLRHRRLDHHGARLGARLRPHRGQPAPAEEINRLAQEVCKENPGKLWAMASYDPRRPRAVALFEQAVKEWGAVGLKVYPPNGYQANDERCFPLYEKAIELDVPVLIHTGGNIWAWPEWVELVARRYPELAHHYGSREPAGALRDGGVLAGADGGLRATATSGWTSATGRPLAP